MPHTPTATDRFTAKTNTNGPVSLYRGAPGPCHLWTGANHGRHTGQFGELYGSFWTTGRSTLAHRYAYEQAHGPIPEGLVADHRCRRRNCVNPNHIEPVTSAENTRRGISGLVNAARQRAKTHCPAGHTLTDPANVYLDPRGARQCRTCRREANRAYRARTLAREQQLAPITPLPARTPTLERQAA